MGARGPDKARFGVSGGAAGSQSMVQEPPSHPGPPGKGEGGKGKRPWGFSWVAVRGKGTDGTGQQPTRMARPLRQL